ncbi:MAG: NPCBM/NEW2 domain-containing protein, partial [Planctomycetia bacterium]
LDGRSETGRLVRFGDDDLSLLQTSPVRTTQMNRSDVLSIEVSNIDKTPVAAPIHVLLTDGSRLACSAYAAKGGDAVWTASDGVPRSASLETIAAVHFRSAAPAELDRWTARSADLLDGDLLEVVRDARRIELPGILGDVDDAGLVFVLDGEELKIRRERLSAAYYKHPKTAAAVAAVLHSRDGSSWSAASLTWSEAGWSVKTPSGTAVELPTAAFARVDFARGRLRYLSELEPRIVEHTPGFDLGWDFRRDQNYDRRPLRIAGRVYSRGLVVHSRTVIVYDLDGAYRRFEADLGMEDSAGRLGDALVRVRVDDEIAMERRVRAGDPPYRLTAPTTGAKRLTLEVDFGERLDLGDHVVFGMARVVK